MKNYVKPEAELLSFQAEGIMLEELGPSDVSGSFTDRYGN